MRLERTRRLAAFGPSGRRAWRSRTGTPDNLQTSDGETTWRFRDYELTLLDWAYDRWMELEIHRLERVRVASS